MKLHISVAQPPLAGYINVDVSKQSIDLANLESLCGPSVCTHIIVNDVIKFMPYDKIISALQHITSRLRHKGQITVIFTDINSIIRSYNRNELNEKQFNELMFNQGAHSSFSYMYLQKIFIALKMNIISIDISKEQVVLVAERP